MIFLPFTLLTIALSGALAGTDRAFTTAVWALIALLSAEAGWQIIRIYRFYQGRASQLPN
jgi:hypothetical protein